MIKRTLLSIFLVTALWLACPLSGGVGTGGQVNSLLTDPKVGLGNVSNYKATLNISFKGTQANQTLNMTAAYVQTEWPKKGAKFTSIDRTDASGQHQILLIGAVGDAQYFQADGSSSCGVNWGALAGGPSGFQLASLLPAVGSAKLVDQLSLDGIASQHYTFDATSLGLPSDATAKGEAWIAKKGGYVVKYMLDITGADSMFGSGVQGTRHMEYELSDVGAHADVVYPAGCGPVLDLPAMGDASDLTRLPGLLAYSTGSKADAVFSFYKDKLAALGWQKNFDSGIGSPSAMTTYIHSDLSTTVTVQVDTDGSSYRVTVTAPQLTSPSASTANSAITPGADTTKIMGSPLAVVTKSGTLLIGTDSKPSPLPSYHLESQLLTPVWAGGKIAQNQETLNADVQGKNVHFVDQTKSAGGSIKNAEAYLIGSQEYDVVNGKVQPAGVSMTALVWKMWPLDLMMIMATGATSATDSGTETLEGRTAEIYTLNVSGAIAPTVAGIGLPVTSVDGKVWVDQQTGALLKAVLDFKADVKDTSGAAQGSGSGHLELTVTKVGQVTVAQPGK
jgi:hypothetical protein